VTERFGSQSSLAPVDRLNCRLKRDATEMDARGPGRPAFFLPTARTLRKEAHTPAPGYQINFMATCTIRPGAALPIEPKVAEFSLLLGVPKFA
jgi:hypothetical protein